jgi:hypothetical protein
MKWQGLSKVKVLKTSEDVLAHSYGKEVKVKAKAKPKSPVPPPSTSPVLEVEESSVEDMANKLVAEYNKNDLIDMAEQAGLDISGTKFDIAMRLVENQAG